MSFIKKAYIISALLLCMVGEAWAQTQQVVSGTVSELLGKNSEPLMGVNITVVNAQNRSLGGTITNLNGQYNLKIPEGEKSLTLVYSYIGMKTVKIKYAGQKLLDVRLESDAQTMGEVEIVAGRIERNSLGIGKQEMISATQKVDMEDLVATSPINSVEEALQGQLGGVDITLSGDPGAKSSIRIRGTSSLNASNDPLIVIDGVPQSMDTGDFNFENANEDDLGALLNLSPNDIKSIEVLKDASATAIWGTQGANGVLVIETKKGYVGKTQFSFSSKWSYNVEPKTIPMLNGKEYISLMQDALWNTANVVGVSQAGSYLEKLFNTPEIKPDPLWTYYQEFNQDTDWLDLVRDNSWTSDNSFSMNGGGEKATYRFSLGWLDQGGTTIGTNLTRLNATLRIDYKFSNKLKFGANFNYSESDKDANWSKDVRSEAFSKMPNKSPYIIDDATGLPLEDYFTSYISDSKWEGDFTANFSKETASNYNPVAMAYLSENTTNERIGRFTIDARYQILPELTYTGYVALDMKATERSKFLPQAVTGVSWGSKWANQAYSGNSESMGIKTENKIMYIKNWKDRHKLIANFIYRTSQSTGSSYSSVTAGNASSNLSDPTTSNNVLGKSDKGLASSKSESRSLSGILHLNYTLLDRYVFQASMSAEGNSAMGRDERMAYFPSGGINWNIQNEPFMAKARESWLGLDELKIRLGVGQSGRAPKGLSYLGAFAAGTNYMNMTGIIPVRMQLDKLKWETNTEYNLGLDVSFFNGRLRFTGDVYKRVTTDLLRTNYRIPSTTGYSTIAYYNSGESENKGWEVRTNIIFLQKKDWFISGSFNLARNENVITKMPDNQAPEGEDKYTFANGKYATRTEIGRPIGSFFGYRYLGVYQNKDATYAKDAKGNVMNDSNGNPVVMKNGNYPCYPGDAMYDDINYDGVINEYDMVYLGNAQPMVTGGASFNIKWKDLSLSATLHGRFGQSIVNMARMNNESMTTSRNQSKATLNRWRKEGDATDIPRALYNYGYNFLGSDRFVEDGSFLRLKTLSLSYNLPKKMCNRFGLTRINVYATVYNLFTWTDYTGQDPEVNVGSSGLAEDNATTPVSRRFAFGLNLNF